MLYISFPCINFYKSLDDSSQLEPKHVAVNKSIKTLVLCENDLIHILVTC